MKHQEPFNILLVGAGGREFALARKIIASPLCAALFVAPLRDAFCGLEKVQSASPSTLTPDGLVAFAKEQKIALVVFGPEEPLVAGVADALRAAEILVFGPDKQGAQLEGSKSAMKQAAQAAGIATAAWQVAESLLEALHFVQTHFAESPNAPLVIKTDGLAAGKGVVVAESEAQAEAAVRAAMESKSFGAAGARLVLEECLYGEELSFFALLDGTGGILPLGSVRDWKRVGVGDTGLNTGGMGSLSPAPHCDAAEEQAIVEQFIRPMDSYLRTQGANYRGVLFAGLMRTAKGLRLLEYNVRFGDPETQSLLPRLRSDLVPLLLATAQGDFSALPAEAQPVWDSRLCLTVVLAAQGYPREYAKGGTISGLDTLAAQTSAEAGGITVVHAATRCDSSTGNWLADGGRVLAVSALADNLPNVKAILQRAIQQVGWHGSFYRTDLVATDTADNGQANS